MFIFLCEVGGYGFIVQWLDDWYYVVYVVFIGEMSGYYLDFVVEDVLSKVMECGFFYDGMFFLFCGCVYGVLILVEVLIWCFVIFVQDYDQVGNCVVGDWFLVFFFFDWLVVVVVLILMVFGILMFFMGEEWGVFMFWQFFMLYLELEFGCVVVEGWVVEFVCMGWDWDVVFDLQDLDIFVWLYFDWEEVGVLGYVWLLVLYCDFV